jgi:YHS domain-containing protein
MWAIGPSTHDEAGDQPGGHHHPKRRPTRPSIRVCGMMVDRGAARAKGLHSRHQEVDYYFCGKGCKLDFIEDPARYLDPSYVRSM